VIQHVIRLKLRDPGEPDDAERVLEAMRMLAGIESVSAGFVGLNVRGNGEYELGAVLSIADEAAFERYLYDPVHFEVDDVVRPRIAAVESFDLADGPDPDIGERLARLARTREENEAHRLPDLDAPEVEP
jgi:hypothetical protein